MTTKLLLFSCLILVSANPALSDEQALKTIRLTVPASEINSWKPHYASLDEYVKTIQPPDSILLAKFNTPTKYLAFFRMPGGRMLFTEQNISDNGPQSEQSQLSIKSPSTKEVASPTKMVTVVNFIISGHEAQEIPLIDNTTMSGWKIYAIVGTLFKVKPEVKGPLQLTYQAWENGSKLPGGTYTVSLPGSPLF